MSLVDMVSRVHPAGGSGEPFDLRGPLPQGTTVLEASAGTGKTFAIAALATRYVAEGHAELSELMLVTFSRAATHELRERVRERLVTAERGLADLDRVSTDPHDELLRLLANAPDDEVQARRSRLVRALAGFDAATIATTHGFCQQMLAGLGLAGDTDRDLQFVEVVDDLVAEVADDLYVKRFAAPAEPRQVEPAEVRKVARDALLDRQAQLVPADAAVGTAAHQRYALAVEARREVERRKRAARLLDYDDQLTRLRDALVDTARGPAARARLRARYRVVLVDEFQDTDPVQWEILRAAFHDYVTLVLIGDPKQAIYAFRGADLTTYLAAVRAATARRTLARNWRSDPGLLTGLDALFRGAALGNPEIVVRPVEASHAAARLSGAAAGAALRLRVVGRSALPAAWKGLPRVDDVRRLVARDVAAEIAGLLDGTTTLAVDGPPRPVRPGDVAVLVRTNDQAVLVRDELLRGGMPAVLTGAKSVFSTPMARQWLTLLHAVEAPHRAGLVRAAALTCFLGWPPEQLATAGDAALDELGPRLRSWREVLASRGVAALLEVITASGRLTERVLATPTGERDVTDLRHIAQVLHAAGVHGRLGPAALVDWLQARVNEAAEDNTDERSRRLESDADAVQVMTVHGSKGLEFPVAYVPFGWDRYVPPKPDPLRLHDGDGTRLLDVGGICGPGYDERLARHQAEEAGEYLRLLYVALTRAQCRVVAWWAPSTTTAASALNRLLFGDFAPGEQPPDTAPVPPDREALGRLKAVAAGSGGHLAVEVVDPLREARWHQPSGPGGALTAARFDRSLDAAWRRTSYTALTATGHDGPARPGGIGEPGVDSEPEVQERQDEAAPAPVALIGGAARSSGQAAGDGSSDDADGTAGGTGADEPRLRAVPSPWADLPSGAAFGTLVHDVLESLDPAAADLPGELSERCAEATARRLGARVDPSALAAALLPALETPLGPLAGFRRLRDVPPADRLPELDFELPLAGGDSPRQSVGTLAGVAQLLRQHLPAADPLAGYAELLARPDLGAQRLRGYLTGSIDAVLRLPAADGRPDRRYLVVDYKTNWLGDVGPTGAEPLTAWHYRPTALAAAMMRAHYPLQALLYSVALHRFLRWRQPGYEPSRHLGGVLYLYLRGMCGTPGPAVDGEPCGVFSWHPPPALVEDLSALLDGRVA